MRMDSRVLIAVAITATLAVLTTADGAHAATRHPRATPAHGNFAGQISVGDGRKLWLRCRGKGSPTVVLESGIHDSSDPGSCRPPSRRSPPVRPSSPASPRSRACAGTTGPGRSATPTRRG